MARNDGNSIAIWGTPQSGKTTFLGMLYYSINETDVGEGWSIFPVGEEAERFIMAVKREIRLNNSFPIATTEESKNYQLSFKREKGRNRGKEYGVDFLDAPGQSYEDLNDEVLSFVTNSKGVLCLFDPTNDEKTKFELTLEENLMRIRSLLHKQHRKIDIPIAICLTKVDQFCNDEVDKETFDQNILQEPEKFIRKQFGDESLNLVHRYCERYRCFAVSAVGIEEEYGFCFPRVFTDERGVVRPRSDVEPLLFKPLEWLFDLIDKAEQVKK
jgi:GTPase SAR1 family protein